MASILKYVVVDKHDQEQDWEEDTYQEAVDEAERRATATGDPWAVIEREYEYSDSALVYTTDQGHGDSISWPPSKREAK